MSGLSTPLIADACVRLEVACGAAPAGIRPLIEGAYIAGRALPARHSGSVDVFLEAFDLASPGDVLVIDNDGDLTEGCIGDLIAIEGRAVGLAGLVIWGAHRDTAELRRLEFPIFSYGSASFGPTTLRSPSAYVLEAARFGEISVTRDQWVFADDDGVLFVPAANVETVIEAAEHIAEVERAQATAVHDGTTLREQLRFDEYRERRAADPHYTFRDHLRSIKGAIEE